MIIGETTLDGILITSLTKASEKKVSAICDSENCNKPLTIIWSNYRTSQRKRNEDGKTFCRKCSCRNNVKIRTKRIPHNKGKKLPFNESKRTDYLASDGYMMSFYDNPNAKNKWETYKKTHRLVMEKELGRDLVKGEIVHHIDGDKINNDIPNLVLLADEVAHRKAHGSLQDIGYLLYRTGYLTFDKSNNVYVAHEKLRKLLEHPEAQLSTT